MSRFLLGCDPGASGGLAWVDPIAGPQAHRMPDTDEGLLFLLRPLCAPVSRKVHAVIELVGGYVKPPRVRISRDPETQRETAELEGGQPGSRMFKFGENVGLLRGVLLGLGASVELAAPRAWMKAFALRKERGQSVTEWKNVLKRTAQRHFPGVKVTLKTADALLILGYAAQKYGQDLAECGMNRPAPPPPDLSIREWKGMLFVTKGTVFIRRANDADLRSLPRRDLMQKAS